MTLDDPDLEPLWVEILLGIRVESRRKSDETDVTTNKKNRLEQARAALSEFEIVMPNCYAKGSAFFKKLTIPFIINVIIKSGAHDRT